VPLAVSESVANPSTSPSWATRSVTRRPSMSKTRFDVCWTASTAPGPPGRSSTEGRVSLTTRTTPAVSSTSCSTWSRS